MTWVTIKLGMDNDVRENLEWATLAGTLALDMWWYEWTLEDRVAVMEFRSSKDADTILGCIDTVSTLGEWGIRRDREGRVTGQLIEVHEEPWQAAERQGVTA